MKILVSAYACNPVPSEAAYPGEAILGWNLIKQLSRFHHLTVLTREFNRIKLDRALKQRAIKNAEFVYVRLPAYMESLLSNYFGVRIYYLFWQIKAYWVAKRLIKKAMYDLFHQITFSNDWMPSFIGALLPLPFVWGPVGGGQVTPYPLLKEFALKDRIKERSRAILQDFWRQNPFRKKCVRKAKAILVCNKESYAKIPADTRKIYFFPVNGISLEEIRQSPKKAQGNVFRIVYAGRLDALKGISIGIKAFSLFIADCPNSEFLIIGKGPEEGRLKSLVAKLHLKSHVQFLPWIPHYELLSELRKADIFLFPSFRDGGGAVVVEAMASCLPVVCLNVGGPGFHIRKEWGIKIEPGKPSEVVDAIARALKQLCQDRNKRLAMGKAGRARARAFYLWDRQGNLLRDVYRKICEENNIIRTAD